jgi:hypothetical protein
MENLYDARRYFTFINKVGSSVTDYALASEGLINNILDLGLG